MVSPFFSIVIPTCNRPALVKRCLYQVFAQELPKGVGFEVVIGDDSHGDPSEKSINRYFPEAIWVRGPGRGPAANRNHAARKAQGEWLVFIDDDTEPHPGFLNGYLEYAKTGKYQALEGKLVCPDKCNSPFYRMPENLSGGLFTSGNLAFHRETFFQIGAFDEDLVLMEDLEIAHRIRTRGIPHAFCPHAAVDHRAQRIGWKHMVWWATHHRWGILYDFKTGKRDPGSPLLPSIPITWVRHLLLLLRTTWHLFSQHDPFTWKNRWFWQAWGWLCLPVTLCALCRAEIDFRKLLLGETCPPPN